RPAAALVRLPVVALASGVVLDLDRRAEHDVDATAVRLPSRDAARELVVRVGDAPVMLLAGVVALPVCRASHPELLDERVSLLRSAELRKDGPLVIRDDVGDVLVRPLLVVLVAQLVLARLRKGGDREVGAKACNRCFLHR